MAVMVILLNGMDAAEAARWTQARIDSGEKPVLPGVGRSLVDKHSTAGFGDKITPMAPLVAACGAAVPQPSGAAGSGAPAARSTSWSRSVAVASLSLAEIATRLADLGAVICVTAPALASADRKLYALRDITGTVVSIPLIASSITQS